MRESRPIASDEPVRASPAPRSTKEPETGSPRRWLGLLLAGIVIAGCATTKGPPRSPRGEPSLETALDEADAPALLLLMADQLLFEPFAVQTIFRRHPEWHERLAVTLGRIGDPRGLPYLESLLEDPAVEIRRSAAFALGQLGDRRAYPHLLGALGDRDREVGRRAVAALARIGLPLGRIEPALAVLPRSELLHRLLPSLFRFTADEIHGAHADLAARGELEAGLEGELERWLLYALARGGDGRGLPSLRAAVDSPDPWVRGWSARALGRLGDRSDLDRLRALLDSPHAGVVVQALRAAAALIDTGRAAPPEDWLGELDRLLEDERSWVRLAAVESAGSWLPSPGLAERLRAIAAVGEGHAGRIALVSLARASDADSEQLVLGAAASSRVPTRRAAARAAAELGFDSALAALRRDAAPAVRMAALSAVLEAAAGSGAAGGISKAETAAREALLDGDPGLRAQALEWLAAYPVAPLDELLLALSALNEERMPDLKVNGAAALAARAESEPLERGAAVAALERLAESPDYLVRRAAGAGLAALGREQPPLGSVTSNRGLRAYREMAETLKTVRWIELTTDRGEIVIELDASNAPLTCLSFAQLVQAGFFDGLSFHRVIPDFVAQGGDPRGDGWGGPGFSLRDENSPVPFERGVVGMARSDTHTAGSQFFLTLSSQPHLDGSYTSFGKVVSGLDNLDLIEQGDLIREARRVGEAEVSGALR